MPKLSSYRSNGILLNGNFYGLPLVNSEANAIEARLDFGYLKYALPVPSWMQNKARHISSSGYVSDIVTLDSGLTSVNGCKLNNCYQCKVEYGSGAFGMSNAGDKFPVLVDQANFDLDTGRYYACRTCNGLDGTRYGAAIVVYNVGFSPIDEEYEYVSSLECYCNGKDRYQAWGSKWWGYLSDLHFNVPLPSTVYKVPIKASTTAHEKLLDDLLRDAAEDLKLQTSNQYAWKQAIASKMGVTSSYRNVGYSDGKTLTQISKQDLQAIADEISARIRSLILTLGSYSLKDTIGPEYNALEKDALLSFQVKDAHYLREIVDTVTGLNALGSLGKGAGLGGDINKVLSSLLKPEGIFAFKEQVKKILVSQGGKGLSWGEHLRAVISDPAKVGSILRSGTLAAAKTDLQFKYGLKLPLKTFTTWQSNMGKLGSLAITEQIAASRSWKGVVSACPCVHEGTVAFGITPPGGYGSFMGFANSVHRMGLDLSFTDVWDLVPLSFVVDWFSQIIPETLSTVDAELNRMRFNYSYRCRTVKTLIPLNVEGITINITRYLRHYDGTPPKKQWGHWTVQDMGSSFTLSSSTEAGAILCTLLDSNLKS